MPDKSTPTRETVLVAGGGIAGMQAALDLAAMGITVHLLERSESIGGNMGRLDKTFPTNDCSTCMIAPRMVACARHPNIHIMTLSELVDLDGEPGRFRARIRRHPRHVDEKLCIGCRQCADRCPKSVPNPYNAALDKRKAVYLVHSQAIPMVPVIDTASCIYFQKGRCRLCEKICPTGAIRFEDPGEELDLAVGAVILAGGYELALVPQAGEYGLGRYPNVVTSLDFERMLSAAGPFAGHPRRPSDGEIPRRIAWIQCVASRDSARNRNFCSSVCCMAAVKQAMLVREHDARSEATIYYMDIRAQGKDFDRYVNRARDIQHVRFVRSMLSQIVENPENRNLVIACYDHHTMGHREEEFDLVVLSAGMKPSDAMAPLLSKLGLELNRYGFIEPDLEQPTLTSREGVFVAGVLDGPKDIPESVTGASAAAASAAACLRMTAGDAVGWGAEPVQAGGALPDGAAEETDLASETSRELLEALAADGFKVEETPRVGVFVCHCGRNIAGVVDVAAVRDHAAALPHVVVAEDFQFSCSTQTQERMKELIEAHGLNRVVVAACSPRTHEPLFRETLRQKGLNPYLFEMANIRDQCSWVHGGEPEAATRKAKALVEAAVARAALLEPVEDVAVQVVQKALVIGGGLAGMTAALALADRDIPVTLVEKELQLGGVARRIVHNPGSGSPRKLVEQTVLRVRSHRNITCFLGSEVRQLEGGVGDFKGRIAQNGRIVPVDAGAVIVATGGRPYEPTEYLYGNHPGIMTQLEFEERFFGGSLSLPDVTVMIQCVGSRSDEFPMCSRVCCSAAVKNALRLLEKKPDATVYVLYRDIRTFGFKEEYYREARDLGAVFVRFEPDAPPDVQIENGRIQVSIFDPSSRMDLRISPDALVLSSGIRPHPGAEPVASMLKLSTGQEGFFMESHPKLSPLDAHTQGVFLCGLAHSPRFIEESLAQARGAAGRAAGLLVQSEIRVSGTVAAVIRDRCSACLTCVHVCPYHVPRMDEHGISVIDPRGCQGCGICVAECPAKAISMKHYTDAQLGAHAGAAAHAPRDAATS
ncbi:MAG: FAD-dependent oxidoreductase [Candidatus Eisenbacteria bacterium]|nr:FAD-dependent oxidoreductase [Candidatus Eisenbacteria bacterium]